MADQKFAYLIYTHKCDNIFKILLRMLDHRLNDIFIHVDDKVDIVPFQEFVSQEKFISNIYFTSRRVKVYWAHISQVQAELILFEDAFKKGGYSYYHLLSGCDLPIKSQDYIHAFFAEREGKNFIGFVNRPNMDMIMKIHIFPKYFRSKNFFIKKIRKFFYKITYRKKYTGTQFKKGCNWVSITPEFVKEIIKKKSFFLNNFKYSISLDEWYKQTTIYNSQLKESIYCIEDEYEGCMRLIDWRRGSPYSWTANDIQEILSSNKLFCRKILDEKLANLIYYRIKN